MNKLFAIVFGLILANSGKSQQSLPIQMDTLLYKYEIIGAGILDYGSTSIQNEFTQKLIYGGFINQAMIDRNSGNHKLQNRAGFDASGEIEFRDYTTRIFNQDKFGYFVRGGYYNYFSTAYSGDVFNLIFNGNSSYKGDTAKFSGTQANLFSFQKIGIGFIHKKSKSNIGLNYYNISGYSDAYIRTGNLAMNADASNLQMDLGGKFNYAEGQKFNKGWGVGLDGDFRLTVKWLNEATAFFQVQLKNIGYMNVNNVSEYQSDSTYNFSGFKFSQLMGDSALTFNSSSQVLDSLGIQKRSKTVHAMLPGFIQIGKVVDQQSSKVVQSYFGVRIFTTLNYTPLIYIGGQVKLFDWMKIGIQASHGGYTNFRIGFYTHYDLGKYHIGIGSENLIGALSKSGYGESLHLKLSRLW
ncbi:MAG: hypothetical protein WC044_03715 [Crocinitomicaceae bacterium]